MSKIKKQFACSNCGGVFGKWSGQCPDCGQWNTISEELLSNGSAILSDTGRVQALSYLSGDLQDTIRIATPIEEFNLVLGGGIVSGSAILIGGDPGIGKSTLLLQLSSSLAQNGLGCLYVTGEESVNQLKLRARRLGIKDNSTNLLAATGVEDIISTINHNKKKLNLIIIDSIQTIATNELSSPPGTVSQIKATANSLINFAKQNDLIIIFACHVNKDGQLAGPKVLEHMVDTVLYFEGDNNNHFRILRSIKNRFGAVNEIGVFEMTSSGLVEINNPSQLFLMERENNVAGSAVFAGIEGSRPLLIEIQALIAPSGMATPRRSVVGWDLNRLSMIIAVLAVRFGLNLTQHEVYLSVAGGLKITEPAADLAVAAALISASSNNPLPAKSVFFGEIGLSGEVRKVPRTETRIKEACKLGFENMYCRFNSGGNRVINEILHIKQLKGII